MRERQLLENRIVGGDEDRFAQGVKLRQDLQEASGVGAVEVGGGFVAEDDLGIGGESPGDGDTLLLSARKTPGILLGFVGDVGQPHRRVDLRLQLLHPHSHRHERHLHILSGAEMLHQVVVLKDHPDVSTPETAQVSIGQLGDRLRFHQDFPAAGPIEPRDDAQQRRLAASADPFEDHTLSLLHRQIDVFERVETLLSTVEMTVEPVNLYDRFHNIASFGSVTAIFQTGSNTAAIKLTP